LKIKDKTRSAAFIKAVVFILLLFPFPVSPGLFGASSLCAVSLNFVVNSEIPSVPLMSGLQFFLLIAVGFFVLKLIFSLKRKKKKKDSQ